MDDEPVADPIEPSFFDFDFDNGATVEGTVERSVLALLCTICDSSSSTELIYQEVTPRPPPATSFLTMDSSP